MLQFYGGGYLKPARTIHRLIKMSDAPHSHIPYGADGSGYYSDHTLGCYDVMNSAQHLVLNSLKEVLQTIKPQVFTIVDYGTADGGTSMPLLYACVKKIKELCGEDQNINIIYEDQPTNDFKSLFFRVQGLIPGPKSYYLDFKNVFVTCSGTSFYKQCFPAETIHFGFSSTCMHWLQKKPCNITSGLHYTQVSNEEEKLLFQEQARKDWEENLLCRATEMKKGARSVLLQFCIDEDGNFLGKTNAIKFSMLTVMNEIVQQMVDEGKVTNDEYTNITFGNYYRTVKEYSAPFENNDSPVYKAGLRLVSIETKIVRCPYRKKWVEEGGDPKEHAKWFIPTTRTWSDHTFYSGLDISRSEEERRGIVDEIFQRYEDKVAINPTDHGVDYVHAHIVIERV